MLERANGASGGLTRSESCPPTCSAENAEYAALEATLRSSELGRRFLADYARKHRAPEVRLLSDAVERLESAALRSQRTNHLHAFVSELVAMSETISDLRREVGKLNLLGIPAIEQLSAPCAFEQIINASAEATSDVLNALEEIQSVSTTLREEGVDPESCDRLDERAFDIYTACARREIAGHHEADAVSVLSVVGQRIDALIEDWSDYETQNLLDAAKALDVSGALATAEPKPPTGSVDENSVRPAQSERSHQSHDSPQEHVATLPRKNRLVPQGEAHKGNLAPANDTGAAELPTNAQGIFNGKRPFGQTEPLTLEKLVHSPRSKLLG